MVRPLERFEISAYIQESNVGEVGLGVAGERGFGEKAKIRKCNFRDTVVNRAVYIRIHVIDCSTKSRAEI